mgnify:CR=1 FL=1
MKVHMKNFLTAFDTFGSALADSAARRDINAVIRRSFRGQRLGLGSRLLDRLADLDGLLGGRFGGLLGGFLGGH